MYQKHSVGQCLWAIIEIELLQNITNFSKPLLLSSMRGEGTVDDSLQLRQGRDHIIWTVRRLPK
eukprot:CAMPEP_0178454646 /NCGR_PEP_ID=MMETSP0689_2-20121128/45481_1 /TAXON_ID=160604 /ORGANISM="Amphidinium massartii, Strain CS-259" /LENGTH=63 /DNA_ID=CAMNT_0020080617 /DNA_START=240 /DNA_END=431 /DNA_ORIENTATION=+